MKKKVKGKKLSRKNRPKIKNKESFEPQKKEIYQKEDIIIRDEFEPQKKSPLKLAKHKKKKKKLKKCVYVIIILLIIIMYIILR